MRFVFLLALPCDGLGTDALTHTGVGISLHLHQTRLLFVSAHLAAHARGLEFRKANALKILDELVVDDFWDERGQQGPRPEKLVDRFEAVFFAGDLKCAFSSSSLRRSPARLTRFSPSK